MKRSFKLKKWHFIAPSVLLTVVSIAYFTAGPRVPMDNDQTSELALAEKESEKVGESTAQFDTEIMVGALSVILTEPQPVKITDEFIDVGDLSPNLVVATLKNNSNKMFEAYSFSLGTPIIENNPEAYCEQIFPMQDDIPAMPDDLEIEPGGERIFYWAYMCEAAKSDPVSLIVTVTDSDLLTYTSTIK